MSKQYNGEYYCPACFHTQAHAEEAESHETWCPSCGNGVMRASYLLEVNPMAISRCGGKNTLSTWEEIKNRPRGGNF